MRRLLPLLFSSIASSIALAQYAPPDPSGLQGVIVERYYIADANDAADTDGGTGLVAGATTYRVFVDLKPGYKLITVGGFENHPITMGTTTSFFNNDDRGGSWGNDINDIHLDKNTVGIDSWLSFGAASDAHWGVLKSEDPDGNAGVLFPNDGGSTGTPLLANEAAGMGLPLNEADGLWAPSAPPSINAVGAGPDLFESGGANTYSSANYAWAVLGGITGPDTNNRILVGQFTTDGTLSLCLNFFVRIPDSLVCDDPACHDLLIYYANLLPSDTAGTSIANDNIFTHPTLCFDSGAGVVDCEGVQGGSALPGTACDDGNADTTNDTYASSCDCLGEDCLGVPGGSALPGTPCDDGNPDTSSDTWVTGCTCEGSVGVEEHTATVMTVAPNPTKDLVRVTLSTLDRTEVRYELLDMLGSVVLSEGLGVRSGATGFVVPMAQLQQGAYLLRVHSGNQVQVRRIVKF